jgi:hypothetical protein
MAKDHFVPQFYLRNFQIPTKRGMIYEYRRKEAPQRVPIKGVAQEEDYYDLKRDDPKTDKDLVDKLLGRTEIASLKADNPIRHATRYSVVLLHWFNFCAVHFTDDTPLQV